MLFIINLFFVEVEMITLPKKTNKIQLQNIKNTIYNKFFINWQINNNVFNKANSCKYKKNNNINKITAITKNTSSNRPAFTQRQLSADSYHNSTCIAAKSTPRS